MAAKLVIDLAKCTTQGQSEVQCSYKHHPQNKGVDSLLEMIRFALVCRRCEAAPCVEACPRGALEKVPSDSDDFGVLKRANMLCTGCGTCAIAAYRQEDFDRFLGLDGEEELVVYLAPVGKVDGA